MREYLDFEKPLRELEERISRLRKSNSQKQSVLDQIEKQTVRLNELEVELFGNLTPWQHSQIARHPQRPSISNYLEMITQDFLELHGDRLFGDDHAVIGGFALLQERPVMIIGQEKGKTLKERMRRNFGMPNPEGYRKALRLMKMAEKFQRPIITFIDTPGAYPGIDAEQHGQAEAIARNLMIMARLHVPIIAIITGEGGSGGALALGVADRVFILEHSIYSVISPEGCAAILWDDASKAAQAASALKLTAPELLKLGIVDQVISEPLGGAHRDIEVTAQQLLNSIDSTLQQLDKLPITTLLHERDEKFRKMSAIREIQ
ncbi:MAG: acetyl-coenzyme A carboxylase carboxyl transferase subunit alpha [Nitrospirales bacterium]|nr:MAG: acetyl-coenzyme A carboxylase carboxyl transferase subunit alpha [Nitrospirales bacterium]